MYKNGVNWRQIMKSPDIEYCSFLTSSSRLPYFQASFDHFKNLHPKFPWHCPVKLGRYESLNVNLSSPTTNALFNNAKLINVGLPNGLYRFIIHMFRKDDPMIFKLDWTNEIHIRLNDDDF